ncbi:endoribonuclease Dicer [Coccinella septempunctata]|uniref:endoribonuclease Dicer n=1 Tax=Coccinella septempunctata TaxID=41139 RepID=UPI001D07A577|nr:endoribonuclease Dicer [Coccinella septempunctata]
MDEQVEFTPRNYQVALFNECLKGNTIIFLPTGAGKTFIAIMVMKKMGGDLIGEKHKVSIILVNTVALVDQHVKYVKKHTPFQCGGYSGEMNVDFWSPGMWHREFEKNQVLIMTSEIFAAIVRGKIFDPSKVNLLIFDECHHAVNDHSMRVLMEAFYDLTSPPKILGLTATLLNGNCKPHKVMEEVRSLEVTFKSKIATVDGLEVVVGYATNPEEHFAFFAPYNTSEIENECLNFIDEQIRIVELLNLKSKKDEERSINKNLKVLEPVDDKKKLLNLMKDIQFHIRMFGIYGGKIACHVGNILLTRILYSCSDVKLAYAVQSIQTCLGGIANYFKMAMKDCKKEKNRISKFSSPKVMKLFEVLKDFRERSDEELCGLVFVERRSTAKVLHYVLKALSENDPDFDFIKSDFIVGASNNVTLSLENMYISKKNKEVLSRFVNKETNLLCTSQVLEEGIDIPKCTMVCKFDVPKDYRSYIQSKGRARHKKSHYYIMVPKDNAMEKFRSRYEEYGSVEKTLNDFLIGKNDEREVPSDKEIKEMRGNQRLKPFYVDGPGSAYVDPVSAVSLLTRYCQTLQSDRYSVYSPEWYYEDVPGGAQVTVVLPTVCPIKEPIQGITMRTKKMAKRAAAYVACIQLYYCGELDQSLLPRQRILEETDISFLFEHYPQIKEVNAGLKKTRLHDLQLPRAIRGRITPKEEVYLHIINIRPLFTIGEDETKFLTTDLTYGFITPNFLPNTCGFPLFIKNGTIRISIRNNVKTIWLSDEEIWAIKKFHFMVFDDVLKVLSECFIMDHSENAESLFLVPVSKSKSDIDYGILEANQEMKCIEYDTEIQKSKIVVNTDTYLNKIVYPRYRSQVSDYLVVAVCADKNPESDFPNNEYVDFCDYYLQKYNEVIINKSQPLLLVKGISQGKNLYKPVGTEKKRKWDDKYTSDTLEYLIPEMLGKREFPAELWIQGRLLPCILYRLTYMLRVESLLKKIGRECGFRINNHVLEDLKVNYDLLKYKAYLGDKENTTPLVKNFEKSERVRALPPALIPSGDNFKIESLEESRYPWKDIDEPKDIERNLDVTSLDIYAYCQFVNQSVTQEQRKEVYSSPKRYNYPALTYQKDYVYKTIKMLFDNNSGIVELADMYEAMTTSKANDIVSLERSETLGDSFLKFITSHYITIRFPHFDEGRATQLKGRMVSNKNLFYLAAKHNIGGIIRNRELRLNNGWIPPGFCIPEKVRQDICDKVVSPMILHSLRFKKDGRLSGTPNYVDFAAERNQYYENNVDDENNAFDDIDHYLKKQLLKDKCVADAVEAIFGTYLLNTGFDGCLKVVQWMGVIPLSENMTELLKRPVPSPALLPDVKLENIKIHLPLYAKIEEILGYTFRNRAYLLQAFTHPSYTPNRVTLSYEKLEFLGDAVLDFLVTCFIFETCPRMTPGDLTDLRSALVNNHTFGSFVVRLGLQKYLLLLNNTLQHYIDNFVDFFARKDFVIDDTVLILMDEDDLKMAEYVDVPKALGDLFEAIAGAIFLDSNYSLETVWKVFNPFMWKEIDSFCNNVPKNVVRQLYEKDVFPVFGDAVVTENGNVEVRLDFLSEGRPKHVYGFGSNKAQAKKAAAKIALRNL